MKKKRGWSIATAQNPRFREVGALMCEVLHRVNEIAMPVSHWCMQSDAVTLRTALENHCTSACIQRSRKEE